MANTLRGQREALHAAISGAVRVASRESCAQPVREELLENVERWQSELAQLDAVFVGAILSRLQLD